MSSSGGDVFSSNAPNALVVCVDCGAPLRSLFREYGAARSGVVRPTTCHSPACRAVSRTARPADRYAEQEGVLTALDLALQRRAAYRHVLVNVGALRLGRHRRGDAAPSARHFSRGLGRAESACAAAAAIAADAYLRLYCRAAIALAARPRAADAADVDGDAEENLSCLGTVPGLLSYLVDDLEPSASLARLQREALAFAASERGGGRAKRRTRDCSACGRYGPDVLFPGLRTGGETFFAEGGALTWAEVATSRLELSAALATQPIDAGDAVLRGLVSDDGAWRREATRYVAVSALELAAFAGCAVVALRTLGFLARSRLRERTATNVRADDGQEDDSATRRPSLQHLGASLGSPAFGLGQVSVLDSSPPSVQECWACVSAILLAAGIGRSLAVLTLAFSFPPLLVMTLVVTTSLSSTAIALDAALDVGALGSWALVVVALAAAAGIEVLLRLLSLI